MRPSNGQNGKEKCLLALYMYIYIYIYILQSTPLSTNRRDCLTSQRNLNGGGCKASRYTEATVWG